MGPQAVEYSKHDAVYARPGIPLSAQVAPVPGSVNSGPAARGEDPPPQSPHQARRPRPPPANIAPRDGRPSHVRSVSSSLLVSVRQHSVFRPHIRRSTMATHRISRHQVVLTIRCLVRIIHPIRLLRRSS
jgi:hypothetical protein